MKLSRRLLLAAPLLATPAHAQTTTIKLTTTAANDLDTQWLAFFKKHLETTSKGALHADIYPASQLGSAPTTIEGVAMGTIEVAINASGLYEALEPRFAVLAMPGLITSMAQGAKLMASPEVRARLEPIGQGKGVRVLTALADAPVGIVSRKPIQTLADFKGMKIRVPGSELLMVQLRELGAAPIAMSLGEVLPAFQNGTIDGVYAGTTIFTALKYYDIAKNMTLLPSTFIIILCIVNNDFVDGLGPLKPVFLDAARAADAEGAQWGIGDVEHGRTLWEQNGGKVFTLSDAEAKTYLDRVIPVAQKALNPAARADYDAIRAVAAKLN